MISQNGTIEMLVSIAACILAARTAIRREHRHHIAAECITLIAIIVITLLDEMNLLIGAHVVSYTFCFFLAAMYLWGSLAEHLSRTHQHFWRGYFLGLPGVIWTRFSDQSAPEAKATQEQ